MKLSASERMEIYVLICCKRGGHFKIWKPHATIIHVFSSVAHVWVPGAKTTGPIAKKFGFLKSNFYVGKNFKFQCDPFSNSSSSSLRSTIGSL
jgi:hypothetical protein